MDNFSFDTLTRLVAAEISRRRVLASAWAGLGAAALLDTHEAPAKKKRKKEKKKRRCRNWILSGGTDPTESIFVDDDLTVLLNDQIKFREDDGESSVVEPIHFTARKDSRLEIVAFDAQADCHELGPLYLHCKGKGKGGSPRKLSDGVPEACPDVAVGTFFEETFTI